MNKVMVVGCPGSGKSTFSIKLHEATGVPLYHLDMLNWNPDRTVVPRPVFRQRLQDVLEKDTWIIDGNYGSTMELRMKCCDTVIFLDYPVEVCLAGIQQRKGKKRPDMPWVEPQGEDDEEFLAFVKAYPQEGRAFVLELLEKYPGKNIVIFRTREEADQFLNNLCI